MIVLNVTYKCKPDKREEFLEMIMAEGIDVASRAEAGNVMYEYYIPTDGGDDLFLLEKWRDEAALAEHGKQPHLARLKEIKTEFVNDTIIEKYKSSNEMDQMDAMTALLTRRSTRNYLPRPVEREKLDKLLTAARQAPSGGNNQTNHFLVIQNRDVLDKLVGMTESAFAGMEVDADTYSSLRHAILASKRGGYVFCYNAPVLIVVANRRDYGNNIADCACAIENIMVAANALDLGSCWINQLRWLNEEPALVEYLRFLGMKEYERVYGAVIVGYPATDSGLPNRNMMAQKGNETTYID